MSKRVLMAGLAIGVGLGALQTGTAEAQWQFALPPGMWWYYGSVDGCATITQVRNPVQHPAILRCEIELTRIETLCLNPANNEVNPGEAATQVVVFNTVDPADISKKEKGKANVCVGVDELSLGPEILCVNRNWNPIAALTTQFLATCTTERCTGDDNPDTPYVNEACNTTEVKDTEVCECTLPAELGFSVDDPPHACPDPLHPDPDPNICTPYSCIELDVNTGLPTGQPCALVQ